jgi:peptide/nickel transport system substrate-binding protein
VADAEIDAARSEPSPEKQLALWKTAQQKIQMEICSVPLFALKQVYVRRNTLDYGYPLEGAMNLNPLITERSSLK